MVSVVPHSQVSTVVNRKRVLSFSTNRTRALRVSHKRVEGVKNGKRENKCRLMREKEGKQVKLTTTTT